MLLNKGKRSADYRRGTIMGLTVAEVFILLSFILLLLLALWRITEEHKYENVLSTVRAIENGAVLVEKENLIRLVKHVERLPYIERDKFTELVSTQGFENAVKWGQKLSDLVEAGHSPEDITKAMSIMEQLNPDDNIEDLIRKIRTKIDESEGVGRDVAKQIQKALGSLVDSKGGEIDPESGAITLPERVLFDPGSAELKDETRQFLDKFCKPWFETLKPYGKHINTLRIEGHASTEWFGVTPDEAFLHNMNLSQRRASAVLEYCLYQVSNSPILNWVQSHVVAVGRSSAKPVIINSVEHKVRSRHVVFSVEMRHSDLIDELKRMTDQ